MSEPTVFIIDDDPSARKGLTRLVRAAGMNAESFASAEDFLASGKSNESGCIVLDVSMPGGGIDTAREITKRVPVVKIIMLTVSEQEDDVQSALKAQARGYVLKGVASNELIAILRDIYNGDSYISPNLAANLLMRSSDGAINKDSIEDFDLNERERQILEKLSIGMSNREIADDIYLSEKTVKHYMTNIMHKLHVSNRVQAAIKAYEMSKR